MKGCIFLISLLLNIQVIGQVVFTNVTEEVGIDYFGRSYGASWNDFDGDGWLEFYTSCHYHLAEPFFTNDFPRLWKNFSGQSFSDTVFTLDVGVEADLHGAVLFDYDNDGDKDILQLSGGTKSNLFYVNNNTTTLTDNAVALNIDLPLGRGRQATCIDIANNGITDIVINNEIPRETGQPTSKVLVKQFGQSYNLAFNNGFNEDYSNISFISDINGDGKMDLVVMKTDSIVFYSIDENGFFHYMNHVIFTNLRDLAIADFTGDLLPDIYVARGRKTNTDIQQFSDNAIHAMFRLNPNSPEAGCTFDLNGSALVRIFPVNNNSTYTLHVGSNTVLQDLSQIYEGEISTDMAILDGWQEPNPEDTGVHLYIGRPTGQEFRVEVRSFSSGQVIGLEVVGQSEILEFNAFGNGSMQDASVRDRLLINQGNYNFTPAPSGQGQMFHNSLSVSHGDYDNDGDIDLYVLSTGHAVNRPDYIYENLGDGTFLMHEDGWGINGNVPGVGDAVTTADYNNDGFLDILVQNGSLTNFLDSAKMQLYRNEGNDNNWIKIIPQGNQSTADGFGAKAYVSSNGITQLREMTGGIHTSSQDDPRLHFGIGSASSVDSVAIYWPSGVVDTYYNIDVNQIMTVIEGSSTTNTSNESKNQFYVYPNPSADGSLRLQDPSRAIAHIDVYDVHGRKLKQVSTTLLQDQSLQLNLPKGIYMLDMKDKGKKTLQTLRWVVGR